MPYSGAGDDSLPQNVQALPEKDRAQWVAVWNSVYSRCMDGDGATPKKCEASAFAQANGVVKKAAAQAAMVAPQPDQVPDYVHQLPIATQARWQDTYKAALAECQEKGGQDCESTAQQIADSHAGLKQPTAMKALQKRVARQDDMVLVPSYVAAHPNEDYHFYVRADHSATDMLGNILRGLVAKRYNGDAVLELTENTPGEPGMAYVPLYDLVLRPRPPEVLFKADEPTPTPGADGFAVMAYIPTDVAEQLADPEGEQAGTLHVTLAYLGKTSDHPEDAPERAKAALEKVARAHPEIQGTVSGMGRFNAAPGSDAKDVLYASFDAPGLNRLREHVVDALEGAGLSVRADHGFTPHITLKYLEPGDSATVNMAPNVAVRIPHLTVAHGETHHHIPLSGGMGQLSPGYRASDTMQQVPENNQQPTEVASDLTSDEATAQPAAEQTVSGQGGPVVIVVREVPQEPTVLKDPDAVLKWAHARTENDGELLLTPALDGIPVMAAHANDQVALYHEATGADIAHDYPEVAAAFYRVGKDIAAEGWLQGTGDNAVLWLHDIMVDGDEDVRDEPFTKRLDRLQALDFGGNAEVMPYGVCKSVGQIESGIAAVESHWQGWQAVGVLVREPDAPYEHGATARVAQVAKAVFGTGDITPPAGGGMRHPAGVPKPAAEATPHHPKPANVNADDDKPKAPKRSPMDVEKGKRRRKKELEAPALVENKAPRKRRKKELEPQGATVAPAVPAPKVDGDRVVPRIGTQKSVSKGRWPGE